MKQLVWGIVLASLGLAAAAGAKGNPNGPAPSYAASAVLPGVGGWLCYRWWHNRELVNRTAELAFRLFRERGRIPGDELSTVLGVNEFQARRILVELKRKGKFPMEAEIF